MQQGLSRWRSAVAAVLAKSTRRDPADLPAEPERLLDSLTYEAFPVRPLYTSLDELPEPPLPGHWPYTRGGDALRDVKSGWKVAEAFPASAATADVANGALLVALTEGISALVLRVGEGGVAPAELGRVLQGVFPANTAWILGPRGTGEGVAICELTFAQAGITKSMNANRNTCKRVFMGTPFSRKEGSRSIPRSSTFRSPIFCRKRFTLSTG
jgi:hypothetical protein